MNRFIALTRIQIKDFLSKYQSSVNVKNKLFGNFILIVAFGALLFPAVQIALTLFHMFQSIGVPHLTITYSYITAVLMMFFTALPFIISVFFYSKDLKFLAALPIKETTIVFAKLSTVYLYLLIIGLIMFAPALVIYGIKLGFTVNFIIFGLLAILLSPVLPLLISALIILPLMRLISSSRNRNLFSIIGGLVFVGLVIGLQVFVSKQQMQPEYFMQFFTEENGLVRFIGQRFPPSIWLTGMIIGSFVDTLLFLLLNTVFIASISFLAKIFYQRAMMNYNEDSAVATGSIYFAQRSKRTQLIRRHILIILKQPTFFLNTFMSLLVPVLMFIILFFTGEISLDTLKAPELQPFLPLIFAGIISSPAVIANISATAITREGKTFWETKVLPISSKVNISSRVLSTIIINLAGSALLLLICLIVIPLTLQAIIYGILICLSLTFFLATADIIINIYNPYLHWTNPTAAVKNNLNVMISLAFRAVLGFCIYLIFFHLIPFQPEVFSITLIIIFTVLYFLTRLLVYNYFIRVFDKITA